MSNREFLYPIKAYLHLKNLAKATAKNPNWLRGFTLDHSKLETVSSTGRK